MPHAIRRPSVAPRSVVGLAAVVLCTALLAWRVRTLAREPRVPLAPRVAQLMYNRMLALRVQAYARAYGCPAYYLDSVEAHLDSADRARVSRLRTDVWGDSVGYMWSFCDFRLWSSGGARPGAAPAPDPPPDSIPPEIAREGLRAPTSEIGEAYAWSDGVGRTYDCFRPR